MVVKPLIRDFLANQFKLIQTQAAKGVGYFLDSVVIASEPRPRRFGECAETWQRNDIIAPKIEAMEWLAGLRPEYAGPTSFLDILPRGHDKSSLEGRLASWLLCYSKNPITGYLVAADKDQAALILDAMQTEAKLNPWLNSQLTFIKNKVCGPSGTLEALPADDAGGYGYRGNLLIFDEFTHWKNDRMWKAVMSGRHKRASLAIVISNAGLLGSWQDGIRQTVKDRPKWHVFEAPERVQLASWMTKDRVDDTRSILPPSEAARVLDNVWIDPVIEAGYLTIDEVKACIDPSRSRSTARNQQYKYVVTWDYGIKNDRSVGTVGHVDENGVCVVDVMDVFAGSHDRPILIDDVEKWIEAQIELFDPKAFIFDPWQMEGTIQKLERRGKKVVRFTYRGAAGNQEMATVLRGRITNKRIVWYEGCGDLTNDTLVDEIAGLRVISKPGSWRFDHDPNKHDDRAVALGMLALYVSEYPAMQTTRRMPVVRIPQANHRPWGTE